MKETNIKKIAEEELKNAKERLEAAKILLKNNKIVDVINRAYYAMFHAARALLILYGEEPKSHEGTIREFSRIITEEKILDKKYGRYFRKTFEARESGDYRIGVIFEREDAEEIFRIAEEFVKVVSKLVKKVIEEKFG